MIWWPCSRQGNEMTYLSPKVRNRWLVILGAAAGLVLLLVWLLAPRPAPADVASVTVGPIAEEVRDQGAARVREAYVVSAPVSGRLERVDLHVGDRVVAGRTVVARVRPASVELLDPRTRAQAEAAIAAANAALSAARAFSDRAAAEASRAENELERTRRLAERGYASGQALDNAETAARTAGSAARAAVAELAARRADLRSARAALLEPEAGDGRSVDVTAPASGYVTRVIQESERTVAVGTPLVEVSDQAGLEAAIEFRSEDAVRIREGMAAEIYDWGGPGPLRAQVRRVEPQGFTKISALGVEEQRVLVLLQFTDPSAAASGLAPGYRVWGRVFLRRETRAVKVPVGALVREDSKWAVFRVERGRARLTPVEVGAVAEREAEIRAGLKAGETVVVFPSDRIRDGVRIETRD